MKPSVGRIVHYLSAELPGKEPPVRCRAAIVTAVHLDDHWLSQGELQPTVDLCIFYSFSHHFEQRLKYDATAQRAGTWHWPERVEDEA